jgi:hypothetical protein
MTWVTTDNVSAEAWRHLLEYANHELAVDAIVKKHGAPDKKLLSNYKKQAQQLRAAILQAKEYFDAAKNSSLITSPNHLYYGMASLCSSIMLLLGTGEKALDKLRQDKENNNHGLEFSTSVNATSCRTGLDILTNSFTRIRGNGFFLQWYSTLPIDSPVYGEIVRSDGPGNLISRTQLGSDRHFGPHEIIGYKASILELLKYLPDLNSSLNNYGVTVPSSRVDYQVTILNGADQNVHSEWRIHGANSSEDLQAILNQFVVTDETKDKLIKHISNNGKSCIVKLTHSGANLITYPSYRETINNEKIMYGSQHLKTHEIVDGYLAAYGLSMLSRYFPDIWVSCLESHCKAAKLIERLLFVLIQKAPVMALATMRSDDFVISTHRPNWF